MEQHEQCELFFQVFPNAALCGSEVRCRFRCSGQQEGADALAGAELMLHQELR